MATHIKMRYNPYLYKVELCLLDKQGFETPLEGNAKDKVEMSYGDRFCLEDDGEDLIHILKESYSGSSVTIEFVGTHDNYERMKAMCSLQDIKLVMSASEHILSCDEINKKIVSKVAQLKKRGYDIDSKGEIDKILDATIPVVVVGNMSAGKSTFLNALIGEELLPSGQNRTTGVNCALHNTPQVVRAEFSISGKRIVIDCTDLKKIDNGDLVPGDLLMALKKEKRAINRIRCVIDYYNYTDEEQTDERASKIDNKLIDIFCPFYNKAIPEQIVFFDTPGGDSDVFKDDEKTLEKALRDQTKGFLILVCAERKDLDKSQKLIETVQSATGDKLDLAHTIVICNQTEEEPDHNMQTSVEKEWASRIIYASAAVALGARKPLAKDTVWKEERILKIFKKNREAFSNPNDDCYTSLPQYSSLPNNRKDGISQVQKELENDLISATDVEKQKNRLMQFNSGIETIEQELIFVANELFPYNQCERARTVFVKLLEEYNREIAEKENEKTQQKEARIKEFRSIYEPLCDALSKLTGTYVSGAKSRFTKRIMESDYKWTEEKGSNFATNTADKFLTKDYYSEHDEEEIRQSIAEAMDADLKNLTKRVEQDFSEFLDEDALPDYTSECRKLINNQGGLSDTEKEVFRDFFTKKKLVDQTKKEREEELKKVKLEVPVLKGKLFGEKWYASAWKAIVNAGSNVVYWFKKNIGGIKDGLKNYHETTYIALTNNLQKQTESIIGEIFENIKSAFNDQSAEDNVICGLNPQLQRIREIIDGLSDNIKVLKGKKKLINQEIIELNNIFSKS